MAPRYTQWPIQSLLYQTGRKNSFVHKGLLSYDVTFESEITPCNKIDKPLVVYRFTGNIMTSIITLRT